MLFHKNAKLHYWIININNKYNFSSLPFLQNTFKVIIIQKDAFTYIFQSVSTSPAPAPVLRDSSVEGTRHRLKKE